MTRRLSVLAALSGLVAPTVPATSAHAAAPLCFGQPATIVGTAGPDSLGGDPFVSEVIHGMGGDDVISGGDWLSEGRAPDLICGGPGHDRLFGAPGNDRISGGDGNDHVEGGRGSDVTYGNAGNDGLADDLFADADSGNDTMRGGTGNDSFALGWGLDKAYGEAGDDLIVDWECTKSYLYGGPGADRLESYWSSFDGTYCSGSVDVLNGQDGVDSAHANRSDTVLYVERIRREG